MKKKITLILFMVSMSAILAVGTLMPGQAFAVTTAVPQSDQVQREFEASPVFGQMGLSNDNVDGDPDSAGDGLGFSGSSLFDILNGIIEDGELTLEELIYLLLEQIILAP